MEAVPRKSDFFLFGENYFLFFNLGGGFVETWQHVVDCKILYSYVRRNSMTIF